jgi:hypothetical protein
MFVGIMIFAACGEWANPRYLLWSEGRIVSQREADVVRQQNPDAKVLPWRTGPSPFATVVLASPLIILVTYSLVRKSTLALLFGYVVFIAELLLVPTY